MDKIDYRTQCPRCRERLERRERVTDTGQNVIIWQCMSCEYLPRWIKDYKKNKIFT